MLAAASLLLPASILGTADIRVKGTLTDTEPGQVQIWPGLRRSRPYYDSAVDVVDVQAPTSGESVRAAGVDARILMWGHPAVGSGDRRGRHEDQGITFALPRIRVSVLPGPAMVRLTRGVVRPQFANGGTV